MSQVGFDALLQRVGTNIAGLLVEAKDDLYKAYLAAPDKKSFPVTIKCSLEPGADNSPVAQVKLRFMPAPQCVLDKEVR